jgi:hypothetical protein
MPNFPCVTASATQKNHISMDQERCRFTVLLVIPTAVELSQFMGVGGRGWPISSSISQKIMACLQFRKRAPSSSSAADATMNSKIEQRVKNSPFILMGVVASGFHPMKKWPHA